MGGWGCIKFGPVSLGLNKKFECSRTLDGPRCASAILSVSRETVSCEPFRKLSPVFYSSDLLSQGSTEKGFFHTVAALRFARNGAIHPKHANRFARIGHQSPTFGGVCGRPTFIQCRCWEELCSLSLSLSKRFPDPSPVLDKNRAPMGPEILSSTGAGVCTKAPEAFPDSSSVLDKFQSASLSKSLESPNLPSSDPQSCMTGKIF